MDTKERKAPARRQRTAQTGKKRARQGAEPARKRRTATHPKAVSDRRKRRAASAAPKRPRAQRRVVRAPREDIPEVVYTMPKTLHRGKFLLRMVSVVAVVMALVMAVSIFFRVDTVTVLGAKKYTPWMVQEASGIQQGDALLTLSEARAAGKIRSALPYVDQVKIDIQLPGTVCIEMTELEVTYAVEASDNTWWLISAEGRAIEKIDAAAASGYTQLQGVQINAPTADQTVQAAADTVPTGAAEETANPDETGETDESDETGETDETQPSAMDAVLPTQAPQTNAQRLSAALSILQALESNGVIGQVSTVNVASLTDIQLQYGQRFQVRLGNDDRLDYKVSYMTSAVNQMAEYQSGVLDLSFEYSQEGIFTPEA